MELEGIVATTSRGVQRFLFRWVGVSNFCVAEVSVRVVFPVGNDSDCGEDADDQRRGINVPVVFLLETDGGDGVKFSGSGTELCMVRSALGAAAREREAVSPLFACPFVEGFSCVCYVRGLSGVLGGDFVWKEWRKRSRVCGIRVDNAAGVYVHAVCQEW